MAHDTMRTAVTAASGQLGGEIVKATVALLGSENAERVAELGEFMGTVIAGIYEGIRGGLSNNQSHFPDAAGRDHQSWNDYFTPLNATDRADFAIYSRVGPLSSESMSYRNLLTRSQVDFVG